MPPRANSENAPLPPHAEEQASPTLLGEIGWGQAVTNVDTLVFADRLAGENGPTHAGYPGRMLRAIHSAQPPAPCWTRPVLYSLPQSGPQVAAALPPCPASPPCEACSNAGSETALVFEASRWGDGVDEEEVTVLALPDAAARTMHRAFTHPNAKGLRLKVTRLFPPPATVEDDAQWFDGLAVLRDARRTALRGILCPPRSEARDKWLNKALLSLDPHESHHVALIALLARHCWTPDPQVRGLLQVALARSPEMLQQRHKEWIRRQLLATVPIVRLSATLCRALTVDGHVTQELVRREMRNAALRGFAVPELPPPPPPKQKTAPGKVWRYWATIDRNGTAIEWDNDTIEWDAQGRQTVVSVVPTAEWVGCWGSV